MMTTGQRNSWNLNFHGNIKASSVLRVTWEQSRLFNTKTSNNSHDDRNNQNFQEQYPDPIHLKESVSVITSVADRIALKYTRHFSGTSV